jgi:hypothetical protein
MLEDNWWKEFIYNDYDFIYNDLKDLKLFIINIYNGTIPIEFISSKYSSFPLGNLLKIFYPKIINYIIENKIFKPIFGELKNFKKICDKIFKDNEFNIFFFENGFIARMILFLKDTFDKLIEDYINNYSKLKKLDKEEVLKQDKFGLELEEHLLSDGFYNLLFEENLKLQNSNYKIREKMKNIEKEILNLILSNISFEQNKINKLIYFKINELIKMGEIYINENKKIYIKPNQFRELFESENSFKLKLPTKKKDFKGDILDEFDMLIINERINYYANCGGEYISFDDLFPGNEKLDNNLKIFSFKKNNLDYFEENVDNEDGEERKFKKENYFFNSDLINNENKIDENFKILFEKYKNTKKIIFFKPNKEIYSKLSISYWDWFYIDFENKLLYLIQDKKEITDSNRIIFSIEKSFPILRNFFGENFLIYFILVSKSCKLEEIKKLVDKNDLNFKNETIIERHGNYYSFRNNIKFKNFNTTTNFKEIFFLKEKDFEKYKNLILINENSLHEYFCINLLPFYTENW